MLLFHWGGPCGFAPGSSRVITTAWQRFGSRLRLLSLIRVTPG